MRLLLLLLPLLAIVSAERKNYDGHQVLRVGPLDDQSYFVLRDLQMTSNALDFWREPAPGQTTDINIPPEGLDAVKAWLEEKGISYSIMIEDLGPLSRSNEAKKLVDFAPKLGSKYAMDWDDYHDHNTLNDFIAALADANEWASIIPIGESYEGRKMNVLAITKAGPGAPNIWIEAGIHAREWISPAVASFIIRELVEDYAEHPSYIDNINWYYLPSANPDGYEYSINQDRYWRKNRAPNSGSSCYGTDLNRNWGFHWGETGVSFDPCSEIYCGSAAFDQPESANIRDFVTTLDPLPVLGHTFHSYSQLWLWPYGYDYGAYPENYKEVQQLAIDASDALFQVHGTVFDPINSADLYPAAGASDDWYKSLGMRYAFTTELRDTGHYGFELPKSQIIPSGEEMWAAFEVVIDRVQQTAAEEKANSNQ